MKTTHIVNDIDFIDYLVSDGDDVSWLGNQVVTEFLNNIKSGKGSSYTINLDKYLQESDTIPKDLLCDPKNWLNDDDIIKYSFSNLENDGTVEKYGLADAPNVLADKAEINVEHDLFDFDIYEEDENGKLVFLNHQFGFPNPEQAIDSYKSDNNVSNDAVLVADCTEKDYVNGDIKSNVILKSEMDRRFPHSGFFRNFDKLTISDSMRSVENTNTINAALSTYSVYTPFTPHQQTDGTTPTNYPEFVNSIDPSETEHQGKLDLPFFGSSASDQVSIKGSPLQLRIVSDAVLTFADNPDYLLVNAAKRFNEHYNEAYGLPEGSTEFADSHKKLLGIQVDINKTINLIKSEDCTSPLYELFAESQYNIHNVKKLFHKASELSSTHEQLQVVAIQLIDDIESIMESDANFAIDEIKDEFRKVWKLEDNNNTIGNTIKNN